MAEKTKNAVANAWNKLTKGDRRRITSNLELSGIAFVAGTTTGVMAELPFLISVGRVITPLPALGLLTGAGIIVGGAFDKDIRDSAMKFIRIFEKEAGHSIHTGIDKIKRFLKHSDKIKAKSKLKKVV